MFWITLPILPVENVTQDKQLSVRLLKFEGSLLLLSINEIPLRKIH